MISGTIQTKCLVIRYSRFVDLSDRLAILTTTSSSPAASPHQAASTSKSIAPNRCSLPGDRGGLRVPELLTRYTPGGARLRLKQGLQITVALIERAIPAWMAVVDQRSPAWHKPTSPLRAALRPAKLHHAVHSMRLTPHHDPINQGDKRCRSRNAPLLWQCARWSAWRLWGSNTQAAQHDEKKAEGGAPTKAVAVLFPTKGSDVKGRVTFTQDGRSIHVHAEISGLVTGRARVSYPRIRRLVRRRYGFRRTL